MKKISLLLFALLSSFTMGFSQGIEYVQAPAEEIAIHPEFSTKLIPFTIWNATKDTLPVALQVIEKDLADGHQVRLFWNYVCGEDNSSSHQEIVMLAPQDTLESAWLKHGDLAEVRNYLEFESTKFEGKSKISLRFLNLNDPSNYVDLDYTFASTVTSNSQTLEQQAISAPYPNPAVSVAYVDYQLPAFIENAHLQLVNLIGNRVANISLASKGGIATVDTRNLSSGVYFVYLIADGKKWSTRKLIVSK